MRLSSGDSEEMGVVGVDIALPPTIKLVVLPRDFGVVTLLECLVFIVGVLGADGLGLAPPLPPDELLVLVFMVGVDTEGSREEVRVTMLALVTEDASDLVLSMSSGLSGSSVISVLIFALLVIINPAEVLGLSSADVTADDVAILELDVTLDCSEHTGPVGVDAVVAVVKVDGSVDEEFEVDGELEVDEELEVEMTNKHSEEGGSCSGFTSLSSDIFLFFPLMEM